MFFRTKLVTVAVLLQSLASFGEFIYQKNFDNLQLPSDMDVIDGVWEPVMSGRAGTGAIAGSTTGDSRALLVKRSLPLPVKYGVATQFMFRDIIDRDIAASTPNSCDKVRSKCVGNSFQQGIPSVVFDYKDPRNFKSFVIWKAYRVIPENSRTDSAFLTNDSTLTPVEPHEEGLRCKIEQVVNGAYSIATSGLCAPWVAVGFRDIYRAVPVAVDVNGRQVRVRVNNVVKLSHVFSTRMRETGVGFRMQNQAIPSNRGYAGTFDYLNVFQVP